MNTATASPAIVPVSATPCWVLPSLGRWDERHFDTREAAYADLANLDDPDHGRDRLLVQRDTPCLIATTVCGYPYDRDGEGIEHLPTLEDAIATLRDAGFRAGPGRALYCPQYSADMGCGCPVDVPRPAPAATP